jgi:kynurenine formamidase
MDAPFHFFEEGRTIDQIPLEQCVGRSLLINLTRELNNGQIDIGHLSNYRGKIREFRKVVIQTGWAKQWGQPEYFMDHPVFTPDAGRFLVDCGVQLVGADIPSVDCPPFPVHIDLLGSDAVIVENLANLSALKAEIFQLIILPLKITGRDGSPVRAMALEVS